MKEYKKLSMLLLAVISSITMMGQGSDYKTSDYNLMGYPKTLRYMKFESDTNIKTQRSSFIEDYQLTFNDNRLLTERVNYINGQSDRHIKYEYDNKRHLSKETLMEKDNKIVSIVNYTYNNIGRLASVNETEYPKSYGGANRVIRNEVYTYNDKGLLIEKNVSSDNSYNNKDIKYYYGPQDSLISTVTTYGYNKNVDKVDYKRAFNNMTIEKTFIRNDKMTRRETYSWNDKFLMRTKEIYDSKNKKILTYTYTYDEMNNLTSEIAIDNKEVKTIEYYYKYEKDKFYNWTKCSMYDGDFLKYTEIRKFEYFDKEHFYEDVKDEHTGRVVKDDEE